MAQMEEMRGKIASYRSKSKESKAMKYEAELKKMEEQYTNTTLLEEKKKKLDKYKASI